MENSSQLLDQGFVKENKTVSIEGNLASAGKRFANYIIDMIAIIVFYFAVIVFFGVMGGIDEGALVGMQLLIYPLMILYYAIFEASSGKTLGKLITGTKVVNMEGKNISFGQALGRSVSRFIPFEAFSFFGSQAIGWHDSLPNTRVINDR